MKKIPLKNWLYLLVTLFILLNGIFFLFFKPKPFLGFLLFISILIGIHLTLKDWRIGSKTKSIKVIHYLFYSFLGLGLTLSLFLFILIKIPQRECKQITPEKIKGVETMIILGAGLKEGELEPHLVDRLDLALEVIQRQGGNGDFHLQKNLESNQNNAGEIPKFRPQEEQRIQIIVTGGIGRGETKSEAKAMGDYLIENGIPEEWIIYEEGATSTFENFELSRNKLLNAGENPYSRPSSGDANNKTFIITSNFHIFRSSQIAKHYGFDPIPLCSEIPLHIKIGATLREIAALAKDGAKLIFTPAPPQTIYLSSNLAEDRLYFNDEVILSGKDGVGEPFVFFMYASRKKKEEGNDFHHFYDAKLFYKGKTYHEKANFLDEQAGIQKHKFFQTFSNQIAPDLSTRESYAFDMEIEGQKLSVVIEGLQGDFLTKNTYEYTRFTSVGEAKISLNGELLKANASLEKAYSGDYDKYVYFDGFDDFEGSSNVFILWDEDNNFYLMDETQAKSQHQGYASHQWVLYKEAETGASQKSFGFELNLEDQTWEITVPNMDFKLNLKAAEPFLEQEKNQGLVQGTVQMEGDEKQVQGLFIYDR